MRRLFPDAADLDDAALVEAYRLPAGRALRVNFIASLDGAVTVGGRSEGLGSPGDKRIFRILRALADAVLVGPGTSSAEGYRPITADSTVGRLRSSLGRPATAPIAVDGRSRALQSPGDERVFHTLRALADVVLVGHGTAAAERYGPVGSESSLARLRTRLGGPPTVPIAVVSRRGSLAPGDRLAVPGTLLVTCAAADAARRAALADVGVEVLVCGDDDVDLPRALEELARRGLEQVTCEGGPQLLRTALAAGIVDELDLTIAPALVGDAARLLDGPLPAVVRTALRQLLEEDDVLFARYAVESATRR